MKFYIFSGCREGYEFDRWLTTPGWPPYVPDLSAGKELTQPAEQLADFWAGKTTDGVSFKILIQLRVQVFFVFFCQSNILSVLLKLISVLYMLTKHSEKKMV